MLPIRPAAVDCAACLPQRNLKLHSRSPTEFGHKKFGCSFVKKPWKSFNFGDRTFSDEVRVKRDKSQSETDFGVFGSLWGSLAIGKTARKLGIFWPHEAHLIHAR